MSLMTSYNLAIKKHKPNFYEQSDIIRLNSPWYTEEELIFTLNNVDKPKFLDINIKERTKAKKTEHEYKKLLEIAGAHKVDWVGISNVEETKTYPDIKKLINNDNTKICAKIETELGCWHISNIMSVFDGIMVDVEDLASQIGWKRASEEKNRIYELCEQHNKPHFRLSGVIFEAVKLETVVYTYGVWDLLHPGHINMLETAKSYGDKLIVGVVGDEAVRKLKGDDRPIQNQETRMAIIKALGCVDVAISQDEYDPIPNLEIIRPNFLVKGNDWEHIPGQEWIEEHGGKLIKPQYSKGWSTSETVKKIQSE